MTKFKVGDKVRFRSDGDIGQHNKMYFGVVCDVNEEYVVLEVSKGMVAISIDDDYWVTPIQIELIPDPKPKFADIKVGDWVEIRIPVEGRGNSFEQCQVIQSGYTIVVVYDDKKTYFNINGFELCTGDDNTIEINRILSPQEVVIDFGSGIKGTVENWLGAKGFLVRCADGRVSAYMYLDALDPKTRAKVESLLKAQEEA